MVQNFSGDIRVETWNRSEIAVVGDAGDDAQVRISREGSRVVIRPDDRRGRRSLDMTLRLPPWAPLDIGGLDLDVTVEGMQAGVTVSNVEGDIQIRRTSGDLSLTTVDGEVTVGAVRGSVRVNAQADDVSLEDVTGDVWVTAGAGDIELIHIDGREVFAETISGQVTFTGRLHSGGTYQFSTHSGDADVTVPSDVSARVSVSTFDGDFESDFAVILERFSTGRQFDFTLGGGAARLSSDARPG